MISVIISEVKRMIRFDKKGTVICLFLGLLTSLLALGYTASMDGLTDKLAAGQYTNALFAFAIFAGIVIGRDVLNGVYNYELSKHRISVEGYLRCDFMEKVQCFSPISLEEPETLDKINKARSGIDGAISTMISVEIILANALIYIVLITVYFCRIHVLLGIVILSLIIPSIISYFAKVKIGTHAEDASAPFRRQMDYAENAVCNLEYFKETKHTGALSFFQKYFQQAAKRFQAVRYAEISKNCRINILVDTAYFLGFAATILSICYLAITNRIFVGDIAAVMVTVRILMSYLDEIFNDKLASIVEAYPGLKNLHEILEMNASEGSDFNAEFKEIVLSEVNFRYPGCQTLALDDIDLTIHAGETICIVGENGSGKTTLSKVISGIYSPTSGTISVDKKVLSGEESTILRNICTAVFQDFQKYAISLADNVTFGKACKIPEIVDGITQVLPNGEKTILSKQFGGTDLSQGQWQRIAIARGISKKAQIIVFDEPTSAIDPILEKELFDEILQNTEQKTKIIVTHRLGIATHADRIIVMDHGRIAQDGTHKELITEAGIYKQLFSDQSKWYN